MLECGRRQMTRVVCDVGQPRRMETCGAEEPYEGNLHVRFCGGCDPFSRNLGRSKGMGAKGSVRTFENLLGVWVRTDVQLPPSWCMRDGSTLRLLSDTQQPGARQG